MYYITIYVIYGSHIDSCSDGRILIVINYKIRVHCVCLSKKEVI